MTEMDKVTQQNAASAEESSSAASELSGAGRGTRLQVAAFQLTAEARTHAAVAPRRTLSLPAASSSPAPPSSGAVPAGAPAVPRGVRNDDAPSASDTPLNRAPLPALSPRLR